MYTYHLLLINYLKYNGLILRGSVTPVSHLNFWPMFQSELGLYIIHTHGQFCCNLNLATLQYRR